MGFADPIHVKTTEINILMYHSISEGAGPTCISPRLFREQLDILEACKFQAVPLAQLPATLQGITDLPSRPVVITFDDAFADFAACAFPELWVRGWPATLFLPAAKMGGTDDWQKAGNSTRPLPIMSWDTAADLGHQGIELGSHAMTHRDLTRLSPAAARDEIVTSRRSIETITGCTVTSFAHPYGRTNPALRQQISECYTVAVGTRLGRATPHSDRFNFPRIEMHYFRNIRRWRDYLEQGSTAYFRARQALRVIRTTVTRPWQA